MHGEGACTRSHLASTPPRRLDRPLLPPRPLPQIVSLWANLLGGVLPLISAHWGYNPAVVTAPLMTSCIDVRHAGAPPRRRGACGAGRRSATSCRRRRLLRRDRPLLRPCLRPCSGLLLYFWIAKWVMGI